MTIKRVEGIRYGVEDMPECIEFLEHWGLEKLESGETGAEFKTPENQTISLRLKTDPVLPPTNEDGRLHWWEGEQGRFSDEVKWFGFRVS